MLGPLEKPFAEYGGIEVALQRRIAVAVGEKYRGGRRGRRRGGNRNISQGSDSGAKGARRGGGRQQAGEIGGSQADMSSDGVGDLFEVRLEEGSVEVRERPGRVRMRLEMGIGVRTILARERYCRFAPHAQTPVEHQQSHGEDVQRVPNTTTKATL